jgi:hypothetical protein
VSAFRRGIPVVNSQHDRRNFKSAAPGPGEKTNPCGTVKPENPGSSSGAGSRLELAPEFLLGVARVAPNSGARLARMAELRFATV